MVNNLDKQYTPFLQEILDNYEDESFLIADGFDDAIIGVEESSMRLIYSVKRCIEILIFIYKRKQ